MRIGVIFPQIEIRRATPAPSATTPRRSRSWATATCWPTTTSSAPTPPSGPTGAAPTTVERSLPRDLRPLRLPGRRHHPAGVGHRRADPAPAADGAGRQAGRRDRRPQRRPAAPGGRGRLERRRVRGPEREFHDRGARCEEQIALHAGALDERGRHLRGPLAPVTDAGTQPPAGPATDPDLDRRLRGGHPQADRPHRRGLVPLARARTRRCGRDGPLRGYADRGRPRSRRPSASSPSSTSAAAPRTNGAPTSQTGRALGATHFCLGTMGNGFTTPEQHLDALARAAKELGVSGAR